MSLQEFSEIRVQTSRIDRLPRSVDSCLTFPIIHSRCCQSLPQSEKLGVAE
jgi:hypothetical protein